MFPTLCCNMLWVLGICGQILMSQEISDRNINIKFLLKNVK
ncbi:hypothetical protein ACQFX9_22385 [Aliinostoc sp. HNIBRCY26]